MYFSVKAQRSKLVIEFSIWKEYFAKIKILFDAIFGGRVKVDFFKVDTRFWRVDLGRNWRLRLRSTHFD